MNDISAAVTTLGALVRLRQTNRLLRLLFPNGDAPAAMLVVNCIAASEELSRDFRFDVELLSDSTDIALKDVVGKMMSIELVREDGSLRYFNGYVFEFKLLKADGGLVHYSALLLPWTAYLRLRMDNYLFHGKSVGDQTHDIFKDYPLRDDEIRIRGDDPVMTDACQYGESDYNYLHRRWESLGWHYWYEHRENGHTLILSDDSSAVNAVDGACPEIAFQREEGSKEAHGIGDWTPVRRIVAGSVALRSYDFKSPRPSSADTPTSNMQGKALTLEVYEYAGAFGFKNNSAGSARSLLGMEAIEATGKHFEAAGDSTFIQPGRWFRLTGHFDGDALGADEQAREFLIVSVRHRASNNYQLNDHLPAHYENTLTCIRKIIPWRPSRGHNSHDTTIYGIQTAIVVGPPGEEIHTDEYGRVRVQFHWDRVGQLDEKSSAWIRVATSWTGANFGMVAVPRIGSEVIVQFLDGNPDRPLITGMVPNAHTMPPWALPANKTQAGMLTRSTPNGSYDNANAIRFEDKKGREQLWLHAERDQLTEVEHDEDKWVGNDRRKTVDRDETNQIRRNRSEIVGHDEAIRIGHDRTETVEHDETITVHNDRSARVDRNEKISIGANRTEDVGKEETISVGANRTFTVAGNEKDKIGKNWSIKVGKMKTETIGKAYMQNVGLGRMENVGLGYSLNVGMIMATTVGMKQTTTVGTTMSVSAGEKMEFVCGSSRLVMTPDAIYLDSPVIHLKSGTTVNIDGPDDVLLNSGTAVRAPGAPQEGE